MACGVRCADRAGLEYPLCSRKMKGEIVSLNGVNIWAECFGNNNNRAVIFIPGATATAVFYMYFENPGCLGYLRSKTDKNRNPTFRPRRHRKKLSKISYS